MCLQQVEYQSVVGLPSVERRPPRNTQPLHAYRRVSPPSAGSLIRRIRKGDEWGPRIRRTHNLTTGQDRIYIHGFSCWVVWRRMFQCFESQEVTALSDIPLFEDFMYAVGEHQEARRSVEYPFWASICVYGRLRVHGLLLEIGASTFTHQGRPRIPASQQRVNKSSDMYRDPSRCYQGPRRTLLKEMTRGDWIGCAGKSTHFKLGLAVNRWRVSQDHEHSWSQLMSHELWSWTTVHMSRSDIV